MSVRKKRKPFKKIIKVIRPVFNFWVAEQTMEHLQAIRVFELNVSTDYFPTKGKVLEIGAGSGWQARELERKGYEVHAIDLGSSDYKQHQVWPVVDYDGHHIPFDNDYFDVVFSSNTLEHIPHIREFQKEIMRILKQDGRAIHLMPSGSWCVWSIVTRFLKYLKFAKPHGEFAKTAISEIYYFRRAWWRQLFLETGWDIKFSGSNRLFYTGDSVMDARLNVSIRSKLSRLLGGSCNLFYLEKA